MTTKYVGRRNRPRRFVFLGEVSCDFVNRVAKIPKRTILEITLNLTK